MGTSPLSAGGVEPPTKFSKKGGGGLTGPQLFGGGGGNKGVIFFKGGRGSHIKIN